MNRSDLIKDLSNRLNHLPEKDIELAVKTMLESFMSALERGDRIEIRGFGSFDRVTHPARTGRNPRTGEFVSVPERNSVHFKPGKELKKRVNSSHE